MSLVNFPAIPSYPDNLTTLQNNGYTALIALGPGVTTLAAGSYWYGSYIRLVFGNDYSLSNTLDNYGIIYNHGSGTISALGAANIGYENNYGTIVAQSSDGPAYGSGSDSRINGFFNSGRIYAFSGTTNAIAFGDYDIGCFVDNEGLLAAHSDATAQGTGSADGIYQVNGGGILNGRNATILAEGPYAEGILVGIGAPNPLPRFEVTNLGTIHAVSTNPAIAAVGLDLNGLDPQAMRVWNSGTITADVAVQVSVPYSGNSVAALVFNAASGILNGAVAFKVGSDVLVNDGTVNGNVTLGTGNAVYFGRYGALSGSVTGGSGTQIIVGSANNGKLAAGSGATTIVSGGARTLVAGSGPDRFVFTDASDSTAARIATITGFVGGNDSIDLSALGLGTVSITTANGVSTITATGSAFALQVDGSVAQSDVILAAPSVSQAATAGGQVLIAPAGGGTLTAYSDPNVFVADSAVDVLLGSAGNDTFVAGTGNDVFDGGGGRNTAVYAAVEQAFVIRENGDGSVTVFNWHGSPDSLPYWTDTLYNVQVLQFTDATVDLAAQTVAIQGNGEVLDLRAGQTLLLSGAWEYADSVNGSNGTVALSGAMAAISGGGNVVTFDGSSFDAATISGTAGNWDTITGLAGTITLQQAQASVFGGYNAITADAGSTMSLYQTYGNWDTVNASGAGVVLTTAQASVLGGNNTLWLQDTQSVASLYSTNGKWDTVYGSGSGVVLNSAQATFYGGGDTLWLNGSANGVSLYATNGNWDTVNAANAVVVLNGVQASVIGGGDVLWFNGTGNQVSLYATNGNWDTVNAANTGVTLNGVQASVNGGGDTLWLGGSGNQVSLYNTGSSADTINGANAVLILNGVTASVNGNGNAVYLHGRTTLSLNGTGELLYADRAFGLETITGFGSSDHLQFAAADFANFAALMGATRQSGTDAVITLDATDVITLKNVTAATLTSSQFGFVAN